MYAGFFFFDHFLVVGFSSSVLMRLMCGRVFHILKLTFQHEYMITAGAVNHNFIEMLIIIDWASDIVLFYSICNCGQIGKPITWSDVRSQICFMLLVSKFPHVVECSCETQLFMNLMSMPFYVSLIWKEANRLLQETVFWNCLVIFGVVHW